MQNLEILWQFSAPTWLVFIFICAAILVAIFYYRQTNPVVSRPLQITLIALRAIALALVLLVIYEWTLGWQYYRKEPPIIAVAIDNSASMSVTDLEGTRSSKIDSIIKTLHQLSWDDLQPYFYTFGHTLEPYADAGDTLYFREDATNISAALTQVYERHAEENLNGIILVTDGNYNQGNNPIRTAAELGIPVYPMGVGSTEAMPDLSLSDLQFNAFAYAGEETPIKISVSNQGFTNRTSQLELSSQDSVLVTKPIKFSSSPSDQTLELPLTLYHPGRQKIVARLNSFDKEITAANNQQTFYINVLKSRIKLFLVAGCPSPEISFIRNALQDKERYELSVILQRPDGGFFDPDQSLDQLPEMDIFLLYGYPNRTSSDVVFRKIIEQLENKPVVFFNHPNSDPEKLAAITELPAITIGPPSNAINLYAVPTAMGRTHPILFLESQKESRVPDWSQFPPVFFSHPRIQPKSDAQVLLSGKTGNNKPNDYPILIAREAKSKSLLIASHDLWRWKLMLSNKEISSPYDDLLNNMVRWLETEHTDDLVRIETMQNQFEFGEPIKARIAVNNPDFQPVDSALVLCELTMNGKIIEENVAQFTGNGTYDFQSTVEQPGDYQLRATASLNGQQIGHASTLFTVGQYNKEYNEVRLQKALLQTLALETNGSFIDSLASLNELQGKSRFKLIKKEREIWNLGWTLLVIITILSLEWFIRKQKGML